MCDFDGLLKLSRSMTKPVNWSVRPLWSESLLFAWRNIGSLATHWAHSKDWSDWADAQSGQSLLWAHMPFRWFCRAQAQLSKQPWSSSVKLCDAHFHLQANFSGLHPSTFIHKTSLSNKFTNTLFMGKGSQNTMKTGFKTPMSLIFVPALSL